MSFRPLRRGGFTLVELMVVVGIIGVLVSIIVPGIAGVHRQAKAIACQSNEKNLYQACIMFVNDHKGFLPVPTIIGETSADPNVGQTCMWALDRAGVANFNAGVIWKYVPLDSRHDMIWCPADDKEYQLNSGVKPDPDRNMSYSINANVRPSQSQRIALALPRYPALPSGFSSGRKSGRTTCGV